jgi:hypothetical protein
VSIVPGEAQAADAIADELRRLARSRDLRFPIKAKALFVEQMTAGPPVTFRGETYDAAFAAQLIPAFFFPLASEDELLAKTLELLMARGMVPLQPVDQVIERTT